MIGMAVPIAIWPHAAANGDSGAVSGGQPPLACVGDCRNVGAVTIDNLITGVSIDLGLTPVAACPAFDRDADGQVAVRDLPGMQYFLPAISQSIHVISPRPELYTNRPVDGVIMRDWLASGFSTPDAVTDQVEEGTLVADFPGVMPFPCSVAPAAVR